jgi:hypothetical protein
MKLVPWSGKLVMSQLIKKIPAFYGTISSITAFKKAHYWTLTCKVQEVTSDCALFADHEELK